MSESLHSPCGCVTIQVRILERLSMRASLFYRFPAAVDSVGKVVKFEALNYRAEKFPHIQKEIHRKLEAESINVLLV